MKKIYENVQMSICFYEVDVITTSNPESDALENFGSISDFTKNSFN